MEVIDKFKGDEALDDLKIERLFPDGSKKQITQNVAIEHHMDVLVNTVPTFEVVCSPDNLANLVIGRLLTQGIVASADEIEQVYVCDYGTRAEVLLNDTSKADFSKQTIESVPTCCTGNKTLNSFFQTEEMPSEVTPIDWSNEWLFAMTTFFKNDSPSHKKSYGTHSCYISHKRQDFETERPLMCEDLGRHNALDKVVGQAVRADYDLTQCMIFTSGRLPVDMVSKAIRARIPILASKAVPTDAAIDLALQSKLTLICSAYPDSADVFLNFR